MNRSHLIGVISDTHGLLRPEAIQTLQGTELIIHAGDVGRQEVLDQLRKIASVVAVRGNVDTGAWAGALPITEVVNIGELTMYDRRRDRHVDWRQIGAGLDRQHIRCSPQ